MSSASLAPPNITEKDKEKYVYVCQITVSGPRTALTETTETSLATRTPFAVCQKTLVCDGCVKGVEKKTGGDRHSNLQVFAMLQGESQWASQGVPLGNLNGGGQLAMGKV